MKPSRQAEAPPFTEAYFTRAFGRGVIMQGGGYTGDVTVTEAYFTRALSRGAIMQGEGGVYKMSVAPIARAHPAAQAHLAAQCFDT